MKLKLERPIVFFDLETTGTNINGDRIVEFAGYRYEPGNSEPTKLVQRINPQMPIPRQASEVHGIYDDDVKDCPTLKDFSSKIYLFLDGADLAGYNIVRFDVPLLYNEMMRCGGYVIDLNVAIIDACTIFFDREKRDLSAAVKFYTGETMVNAHAAASDVEATIKILDGQLAMYDDLAQTPSEIWGQTRDPDAVDLAGKMKWEGSSVVLTFGKQKGKALEQIGTGYLSWMLNNGVIGPDGVGMIKDAINGKYPSR